MEKKTTYELLLHAFGSKLNSSIFGCNIISFLKVLDPSFVIGHICLAFPVELNKVTQHTVDTNQTLILRTLFCCS